MTNHTEETYRATAHSCLAGFTPKQQIANVAKALAKERVDGTANLQLRSMETADTDRPILAWCDYRADPFIADEATGRLTLYAAHAESTSHASVGWHIIEWGGAVEDADGSLPDWWFVVGSDFEVAANPICWVALPPDPRNEESNNAEE